MFHRFLYVYQRVVPKSGSLVPDSFFPSRFQFLAPAFPPANGKYHEISSMRGESLPSKKNGCFTPCWIRKNALKALIHLIPSEIWPRRSGRKPAGRGSKGCSNSRPKGEKNKKYRATVKLVKMELLWNISPTTRYNWMISPQSLGDGHKGFRDR